MNSAPYIDQIHDFLIEIDFLPIRKRDSGQFLGNGFWWIIPGIWIMKSYVIDLSRTMDQWCDSIQTEVEKFDIEFVFQQIG